MAFLSKENRPVKFANPTYGVLLSCCTVGSRHKGFICKTVVMIVMIFVVATVDGSFELRVSTHQLMVRRYVSIFF